MFLMPLGLEAKTKDFPSATVIIFTVTALVSVAFMHDLPQYSRFTILNEAAKNSLQMKVALAHQICGQAGLSQAECQLLERIKDKKVTNMKSLLDLLTKEQTEVMVKLSASKQQMLAKEHIASLKKLIELFQNETLWDSSTEAQFSVNEWKSLHESRTAFQKDRLEFKRERKLLSKESFSLIAMLKSIFIHDGWLHLISNMVFLLIFAIPTEQRMGPFWLLGVYFFGAFCGNLVELSQIKSPLTVLLGASGGVFAVAGAFLALFYRHQMRVYLNYLFLVHRVILMPTWIFVFFYMIAEELSGLSGESQGVAYLAHLGGFGFGVGTGFWFGKVYRPIESQFAFEFELEYYLRAKKSTDLGIRLKFLLRALHYNPINPLLLIEAYQCLCERLAKLERLEKKDKFFLAVHLPELIRIVHRRFSKGEVIPEDVFEQLPRTIKFYHKYIRKEVVEDLILIACSASESNKLVIAKAYYNAAIQMDPERKYLQDFEEAIEHLEGDLQNVS